MDTKNKYVRVVMRITKPCFEPATEEVRVLLSEKKEFQKWNLEETRVTEFCGGNLFHLEIGLPANSMIWFKLFVLRVKGREIMNVEEFARELRLDTRATMCKMDYNDPAVMTREMKSHLTRTGDPVNIAVRIPSFNHSKPKPGGWYMDHDIYTDDEYHRAEYYGCDGKVFCKVRSPRKSKKPDFTNKQPDTEKGNYANKATKCAKCVSKAGTTNDVVNRDNSARDEEKRFIQTYKDNMNSDIATPCSTPPSNVQEVRCNVSVYNGVVGTDNQTGKTCPVRPTTRDEADYKLKAEEYSNVHTRKNELLKFDAKEKDNVNSFVEESTDVFKNDPVIRQNKKCKRKDRRGIKELLEKQLGPNCCIRDCLPRLGNSQKHTLSSHKNMPKHIRATPEKDDNNNILTNVGDKKQLTDPQKETADKMHGVKGSFKFGISVGVAGIVGVAVGAFVMSRLRK